ncbi:prolyl oligopeptidase family serine peptidase [Actinosynnema sp. NPDC023587]|uniref:alpha/beta hydrolase family protein n=1 Tax=Actinosynnema sp. NPDC023587 TaxID=3154695 RepID=UPI0033F0376A
MSCWLPTRTDRFRAVVAGGVVSDLVSMTGTSDVGSVIAEFEIGDTGLLRELSPLTHADEVSSPTLVLHGGADERCPVGQAEQWYHALLANGVTTELVVYPGGSHLFVLDGKPSHRLDYNRRVVDWVVANTGER